MNDVVSTAGVTIHELENFADAMDGVNIADAVNDLKLLCLEMVPSQFCVWDKCHVPPQMLRLATKWKVCRLGSQRTFPLWDDTPTI